MKNRKIGFIGAGNMGEALMTGILKTKEVYPRDILVSDISRSRLQYIEKEYGTRTTGDNKKVARDSEVVILAIKPQIIKKVIKEISQVTDKTKLIISIAAGVSIEFIELNLAKESRVIRAMPNTPALVQEGATALVAGRHATKEDAKLAGKIFNSVGKTILVDESLMDAVTGLSGSGPAYVFLIIEALADAGVKMGLSRNDSQMLAAQTLLGSARLFFEKGEHPGKLKDMVTSPGGTTIAGLHALEQGGIRAALIDAVERATRRSQEIGKEIKERGDVC
jgi:pyrroline-5-carboxylate reductase